MADAAYINNGECSFQMFQEQCWSNTLAYPELADFFEAHPRLVYRMVI